MNSFSFLATSRFISVLCYVAHEIIALQIIYEIVASFRVRP
jgi:hypothetical protein